MICKLTKRVTSYAACPFHSGDLCKARDNLCKCNPAKGTNFPRRCPLRNGPIAVARTQPIHVGKE